MSAEILSDRTVKLADLKITQLCENIPVQRPSCSRLWEEFLANSAAERGFT